MWSSGPLKRSFFIKKFAKSNNWSKKDGKIKYTGIGRVETSEGDTGTVYNFPCRVMSMTLSRIPNLVKIGQEVLAWRGRGRILGFSVNLRLRHSNTECEDAANMYRRHTESADSKTLIDTVPLDFLLTIDLSLLLDALKYAHRGQQRPAPVSMLTNVGSPA